MTSSRGARSSSRYRSTRAAHAATVALALVAGLLAATPSVAADPVPTSAPDLVAGESVGAPAGSRLVGTVGVTDTSLVAEAVGADGASRLVSFDRTDPGSGWVDGWRGITTLHGPITAAEGGTLVTTEPDGRIRLTWGPGDATRVVPADARVDQDGTAVVIPGAPTGVTTLWIAEDIATGVETTRLLAWLGFGADLDGGVVTPWPGGPSEADSSTCRPPSARVSGRWIAQLCAAAIWIADDAQVYKTWQTPLPVDVTDVEVGSGVVAMARPAMVQTQDILGARSVHTYGPSVSPGIDMDEAGTTLAYVDPDGGGRLVATASGELALTISPEEVAPGASAFEVTALTSPTRDFRIWWGTADFGDATYLPVAGPLTYEVSLRQKARGASAYGPWSTATRTTDRDLTVTASPGTGTCVRVRATDANGNTGPWSNAPCVTVDGTAPKVTASGPAAVVKASSGKATLTVRYKATDAGQLASYDVAYRKGITGKGYGSWVFPASWQRTKTLTRSLTARSSDHVCFAVRARDAAGNVSAWRYPSCTLVDGTAPRMTAVTITRPFTAPGLFGATSVRPAAKDESRVTYETWNVTYSPTSTTDFDGRPIYRWGKPWISLTSPLRIDNVGGQTGCVRVRARDEVGHVSAWSALHCASTPQVGTDFNDRWFTDLRPTSTWRTVPPHRKIDSKHSLAGRSIRFTLNGGPHQGGFDVYQGSRKLGHVSAYASRSGSKVVTLKASKAFAGHLTLKQTSSTYTTEIKDWVVLP